MKRFISVVALTALGLSSAYAQPDLEQCKEMARKHFLSQEEIPAPDRASGV